MPQQDHGRDAGWIRQFVERYEGPLVRYALRITGDEGRARDVVQEAFLQLCREAPAGLDGHAAAWLYRVCRNRALDVRKKESRMNPLADAAEALADPTPGQPHIVEQQETAHQVADQLAALPEKQQEVIRLKFQAGLSYREISEVTGLSVSNVGYLMHTAIHTMRRRLAPGVPLRANMTEPRGKS